MTQNNPGMSKFTVLIDEDLAARLAKLFHHGEKVHFFRALLEALTLMFESGKREEIMKWLYAGGVLHIPSVKKGKD